jgi:hypothetical protein
MDQRGHADRLAVADQRDDGGLDALPKDGLGWRSLPSSSLLERERGHEEANHR